MNKSLVSTVILVVLVVTIGAWYLLRVPAPPTSITETSNALATELLEVAPGFAAATDSTSSLQASTAASGPLAGPRPAPAGYKEYRNTTYRFSLFYPQDLTLHEYDEGGGASTITFENAKTVQGFQIFIVPYGGTQVSTERFNKDAPSGVMQDPQSIQLDGTLATIFFSTNPLLGETREVWFIHGGYLFEVTAPKDNATWLSGIVLSWKFI